MKKETILLVDDNAQNIDVLVELLNDYELLVSLNALNAFELLKKNSVDLILLDIMMPDMDGIEMASHLKNDITTEKIPILFISAKHDEKSIENGFRAGGLDYITKPFKPLELRARVKTHLKLYKSLQQLEYIANYDYLSGAKNRRSFFREAKEYLEKTPAEELFAVMIDIDKFKRVNDTYGHGVGDIVIKILSKNIESHISSDMLYARIGGEEFAILINSNSSKSVFEWVESLRMLVEKIEIPAEEGVIQISISCGISQRSSKEQTIDSLLDKADFSLYGAKEGGRNRVVFRV